MGQVKNSEHLGHYTPGAGFLSCLRVETNYYGRPRSLILETKMRKTTNEQNPSFFDRMTGAFSTCLSVILLAAVGSSANPASGSVVVPDQAAQSWLMSNNAASFTFSGSQQGLTSGTVYTLSTAGNSLGFCTLSPNTQTTPPQYTTSCFTGYGTILGSGQSYSAVAFLGTQNNPTASFIVGDSAGNVSIATPIFQPSNTQAGSPYVVTGLNMTSMQSCPSGTAVANLATDPSGGYVYIGCYSAYMNPIVVGNPNSKYIFNLPGYTLYSAPIEVINAKGGIVTLGAYTLQNVGFGIFGASGNSQQAQNQVAAVWPGVSTVMRTYSAGYPGLANTSFASTGGVLISGLINAVTADSSSSANDGPQLISNAALMCSNGNCGVAITRGNSTGQPAQIATAFEVGMDSYPGPYFMPALYSSTLTLASNQVWTQSCPSVMVEKCNQGYSYPPFFGTIFWQNVSPTISSCGNSISGGFSCNAYSQTLIWPPNGMPAPGNGYQIDITNLTYVPAPATNSSPFTQGLLLIGTWTNGYLSYHSPANPNQSIGLFLNQENGGNIGNVNSMNVDNNGNLMVQTGSQGLYVMNPFVGTNTATGTDATLITQPADSSGSFISNLVNDLLDPAELIYYVLGAIKFLAPAAALPPETAVVSPKKFEQRSAEQADLTPRYSLIGPFNLKNYRGQFVYTQSQLASLGLNPGDVIQGMRFRDEEGKVAAPAKNLNLRGMKITLSKPALTSEIPELKPQFSRNSGSNKKTVRSGPMTLFQGGLPSTGVHPDQGVGTGVYGQLIPFRSPYIYEGGNLLVDIESSGKAYKELVSVDAFGTRLNQGLYQTPKTKRPIPLRSVPALDFVK